MKLTSPQKAQIRQKISPHTSLNEAGDDCPNPFLDENADEEHPACQVKNRQPRPKAVEHEQASGRDGECNR